MYFDIYGIIQFYPSLPKLESIIDFCYSHLTIDYSNKIGKYLLGVLESSSSTTKNIFIAMPRLEMFSHQSSALI